MAYWDVEPDPEYVERDPYPILSQDERTHGDICDFCGYELDDTRLKRRGAWFHESCLINMEAKGAIDEF